MKEILSKTNQSITLDGHVVEYELKLRKVGAKRAQTIRLVIHPERGLVVTIPRSASKESAERFMKEKSVWIVKTLEKFRKISASAPKKLTTAEIEVYRKRAKTLAATRLAYFNSMYHFTYREIRIKDQKTRWGSCSGKGSLNFNYRIALLPSELADYIIVHELCHIGQMNHSSKFWSLVAETIPDYLERRAALRKKYSLLS